MNPKYTLIYECHYPGQSAVKNTLEFEAETLSEVLENMERFLKGSGFEFNGTLEIVEEEK